MQDKVAAPSELELVGKVGWCNHAHGIVNFQPDRLDARKHEVRFYLHKTGDSCREVKANRGSAPLAGKDYDMWRW